jgi:hypothetical protein
VVDRIEKGGGGNDTATIQAGSAAAGATICHIPLHDEMNYSRPAIYTGEKDGDVSSRYRTFFSGYRSNYTDYLVR